MPEPSGRECRDRECAYREIRVSGRHRGVAGDVVAGLGRGREGIQDHPALTRFEGAEIRAYEHKDFDEAVMPDRPIPREAEAKGLELEGKLTRISYRIDGKKSALEVYRNYQGALQAGGFKTLFECKGDEQCGGDFQSFVINGGKVRQPGQGDATFGGKYYVVLARRKRPPATSTCSWT